MFKPQICYSQPHIEIPEDYLDHAITTIRRKKIGEILQEADLVSSVQVEVALQDQKQHRELHLGEILALRGWIKQQTADFFAQQWYDKISHPGKDPIGKYLQEAGLLSKQQIELILQEQKTTFLKFGAIAVLKGWLKQNTLDFFIHNLFPEREAESIYVTHSTSGSKIIQPQRQPQFTKETEVIRPKQQPQVKSEARIIQPQFQPQPDHEEPDIFKLIEELRQDPDFRIQ